MSYDRAWGLADRMQSVRAARIRVKVSKKGCPGSDFCRPFQQVHRYNMIVTSSFFAWDNFRKSLETGQFSKLCKKYVENKATIGYLSLTKSYTVVSVVVSKKNKY